MAAQVRRVRVQLMGLFVLVAILVGLVGGKTNTTVAPATPPPDNLQPPDNTDEDVDVSFAFLLLLGGMLLTFLVGYLIEATRFEFLHEAGAAILFGMAIGALVRYTSSGEKMKTVMVFNQETFFFLLLPPIIFESGYNMKRGNFFYNMGSICLFAFIGTLISSLVIGGLVYLVSGVLGWGGNLTFIESFLFGALISATDPVTVLSIFSALKVQKDLYADVFGESVLNDAVAIIFYRTLLRFLKEEFQAETLLWAVLDFSKVFCGSFAIAVLIGMLSALLFKHIDLYKHPVLEMLLVIIYAFAAYLLAEGLRLSGIVAILFVGITMAHYTYGNLSKESQIVTKKMFKVVATLCETTVFIYLGLAIFSFESNTEFSWGLIGCSLPILGISRALNIFPLAFLLNLIRPDSHKIPMKHQIILWFSGLRGAIAFALSLNVPTDGEAVIFTTTLMIVLFTVLFLGALTIPILKFLGVEMGGHGATGTPKHSSDAERRFAKSSWFMRIDRNYLKPFFTKSVHVPFQRSVGEDLQASSPNSFPLTQVQTNEEGQNTEPPGNGGESDPPRRESQSGRVEQYRDNDEDSSSSSTDPLGKRKGGSMTIQPPPTNTNMSLTPLETLDSDSEDEVKKHETQTLV